MFNVNIDGILAMQRRIQSVQDYMPYYCQGAVELVAEAAIQALEEACPYDGELDNGQIPGEEGHLNQSFYPVDDFVGVETRVTIKTEEPIKLSYVTGGTNTPILPLAMRGMWWPALSHPVASVQGQKANDFVTPSRDEIASEVPDIIQPVIDEIIQALDQ